MPKMQKLLWLSLLVNIWPYVWIATALDQASLNALQDLYRANGPHWLWPVGAVRWDFSNLATVQPCTEKWYGIACSSQSSIVQLNLPRMGIAGTLPASISASLTALQVLNLADNILSGTLSSSSSSSSSSSLSFPSNSAIVYCDLGFNNFVGRVPSALGSLSKLLFLGLYGNSFTGQLPSQFSSLVNLQQLEAFGNRLTGPIFDVTNLKRLSRISLFSNFLSQSIPSSMCLLTSLQVLNLWTNKLTGSIPSCIGGLSQLTFLKLGSNSLRGTPPVELGGLTLLNNLVLSSNNFDAWSIPSTFSFLSNLQLLDVASSNLVGALDVVKTWKRLTTLRAGNNRLAGPLPDFSFNTQLRFLELGQNRFSSSLSQTAFTSNPLLNRLSLGSNNFVGRIPSQLSLLTHMIDLDISGNAFSGPVPNLSQMASLLQVQLQNNALTAGGSGVALNSMVDGAIQTKLAVVNIASNHFSSTLPGTFFRLPSLSNFIAQQNCFFGSLPSSICFATSLISLSLDGLTSGPTCKQASWQQPNAFGMNATYSKRLMKGTIPSCVFQNMPSLVSIHLAGNGLTGSLPQVLNLPNLTDLSLANNMLVGPIPKQLLENKCLANLDLSFNKFQGGWRELVGGEGAERASMSLSNRGRPTPTH